jgi:predicted phosphodiesterase
MKIVVLTDIHANLPAIEAVIKDIRSEGYDAIFHTGDVIGIGPYPAECMELLLNLDNIRFVMGNHDFWYVNGLPQPRPEWMSEGELHHQHWTHSRLGSDFREVIASWPFIIEEEFGAFHVAFMHYGLGEDAQSFKSFVLNPSQRDLDKMFTSIDADFIFFGHDHLYSDILGNSRYINPGSLGCQKTPEAPYCIVEFRDGDFKVRHCRALYDDEELYKTFEARDVPEKEFIYKAFFGGRFPT